MGKRKQLGSPHALSDRSLISLGAMLAGRTKLISNAAFDEAYECFSEFKDKFSATELNDICCHRGAEAVERYFDWVVEGENDHHNMLPGIGFYVKNETRRRVADLLGENSGCGTITEVTKGNPGINVWYVDLPRGGFRSEGNSIVSIFLHSRNGGLVSRYSNRQNFEKKHLIVVEGYNGRPTMFRKWA